MVNAHLVPSGLQGRDSSRIDWINLRLGDTHQHGAGYCSVIDILDAHVLVYNIPNIFYTFQEFFSYLVVFERV